jgi:hypothetical protein
MPRLESRGSGVVIKDNSDMSIAYFPPQSGDMNMALDLPQVALNAEGLKGEAYPRLLGSGQVVLASQVVTGVRVPLRAGTPVTNLHCGVITAGAGTPPTLLKMALLQRQGSSGTTWVTFGMSANLAADPMWTTVGIKTVPLLVPVTVPADDAYYVANLCDGAFGTTAMQIARVVPVSGNLVLGIGSGILPAAAVGGRTDFPAVGQTMSLPAPSQSGFWFGVS